MVTEALVAEKESMIHTHSKVAVIVWLATLVFLIPYRRTSVAVMYLLLFLPRPILMGPQLHTFVLLSYPIGILIVVLSSAGVVLSLGQNKAVPLVVALVDGAALAAALVLTIVYGL